jgi:nucleotide-binding universal stress UspA family protein
VGDLAARAPPAEHCGERNRLPVEPIVISARSRRREKVPRVKSPPALARPRRRAHAVTKPGDRPRRRGFAIEPAAEAQSLVEHAAQELDDAGIKTHYEVRNTTYGRAAREIVAAAGAHGADVIVMGSRGRSDVAGFVLGSTAHKVVHLSDRPVLVVR